MPNRYRKRKLPLQIERGFLDRDEYDIDLPKGYAIDFIPGNISMENKFGRYSAVIERIDDRRLKYARIFEIYGGEYPKDEYENYRNFIKEVSKNDNAKIVLIKE